MAKVETRMQLQKCVFQRKAHGPQEEGIMINDNQLIIDAKGIPVTSAPYNYTITIWEFSVSIPLKGE